MQISGYNPALNRRPSTSFPVRQAFSASPRIHSAQARLGMTSPRSQVSFAGFYDWTEDGGGDVSVTNVYRKIANASKSKIFNKGNKTWCTDGIHLNPGRMFVRDKADLTKGEKEIIAGIYKNRGDIQRDKNEIKRIRCHRDAWLVGKNVGKREIKAVLDEGKAVKIPEGFFSTKLENPMNLPARNNCYMCNKCKEDCAYHHLDDFTYDSYPKTDRPGRVAPPSSPDGSPQNVRKFGKHPIPPIKLGQGAITIERGPTFIDSEDCVSKRKVFMDVFLPKIGTQVPVDELNKTPVPNGSKSPVLNDTSECERKHEHVVKSPRNGVEETLLTRNDQIDHKVLNLNKTIRQLYRNSDIISPRNDVIDTILTGDDQFDTKVLYSNKTVRRLYRTSSRDGSSGE